MNEADVFQTIQTIPERCRVCYTCVRECPAKAIRILDGQARVIHERCIGCGLCVTVCDFDAMALKDKPDMERWEPPKTLVDTYMKIAQEKGLFG